VLGPFASPLPPSFLRWVGASYRVGPSRIASSKRFRRFGADFGASDPPMPWKENVGIPSTSAAVRMGATSHAPVR
jgi:hypothetical protein